jgi:hypothetical protein
MGSVFGEVDPAPPGQSLSYTALLTERVDGDVRKNVQEADELALRRPHKSGPKLTRSQIFLARLGRVR